MYIQKIISITAVFLLIGMSAAPTEAQTLRPDGDGDYRRLADHGRSARRPYSYTEIGGPPAYIREGRRSMRFEVRAGDCRAEDCHTNRERVERAEQRGLRPGTNQWHSWSMFIDPGFRAVDRVPVTLGQMKQEPFGSQLFSINVEHDYLVAILGRLTDQEAARDKDSGNVQFLIDHRLMPMREARGRWLDFMVHSNWSPNEDGYFDLYLNGQRIASHRGKITYNPSDDVTFRFGIYRSHIQRHSGPMPTHIVFYDNVRRAGSRAEVDLNQ